MAKRIENITGSWCKDCAYFSPSKGDLRDDCINRDVYCTVGNCHVKTDDYSIIYPAGAIVKYKSCNKSYIGMVHSDKQSANHRVSIANFSTPRRQGLDYVVPAAILSQLSDDYVVNNHSYISREMIEEARQAANKNIYRLTSTFYDSYKALQQARFEVGEIVYCRFSKNYRHVPIVKGRKIEDFPTGSKHWHFLPTLIVKKYEDRSRYWKKIKYEVIDVSGRKDAGLIKIVTVKELTRKPTSNEPAPMETLAARFLLEEKKERYNDM